MCMLRLYRILIWGLTIFFVGCIELGKDSEGIHQLKEEFGGNWSTSKVDGCYVLTIIGSERVDSNPDSIDFYLDQVEQMTMGFKVGDCIHLEHKIVRQNGVVKKEEAHLYLIRAN